MRTTHSHFPMALLSIQNVKVINFQKMENEETWKMKLMSFWQARCQLWEATTVFLQNTGASNDTSVKKVPTPIEQDEGGNEKQAIHKYDEDAKACVIV